ncbi:response regulator [Sediminibacterium soli]|uniref:response regulator n=1 Tax=Sediminibacterium soli TaxID=2698829 RepID=UPI001379B0C2|nr:response regulator [Sediminibacterium soli]NCI47853.1 response regulator [Sediminibacterium soli]
MPFAKHIVFLIDDDNIYQFTARKILESTGLAKEIVSFYNGKEAIKYLTDDKNRLSENFPDLIFLDINMPIMNGWEFLEEYHSLYGNFPKPVVVYVVSSSIDSHDMKKSRQYKGVTDYIVKPVTRVKYKELIESL